MTLASPTERKIDRDVPYGLSVAAAWAWRVIAVVLMVGVVLWLLGHVTLILIPVIVAALLASLLEPLHRRLHITLPAIAASLLSVLALILGVAGLLALSGQQLVTGFADMSEQISKGVKSAMAWAEGMGLPIGGSGGGLESTMSTLKENSGAIMSGAMSFSSTATNILAGIVIALFTLIFFLYDGDRIWAFCLRFVPRAHRRAIDHAGRSGWHAVGSYVRVQIVVAAIDALGIGLGAWLLGVPLAFPLAVLVFLASFVPMVGAVATGALAILLALMANGPINAVLMLGVVILVQQLESNVLQPLIMGKAVALHPLAVFLAVAGGSAVAGLAGAVFSVPMLAFLNAFVRGLRKEQHENEEADGDSEAGDADRTPSDGADAGVSDGAVPAHEPSAARVSDTGSSAHEG